MVEIVRFETNSVDFEAIETGRAKVIVKTGEEEMSILTEFNARLFGATLEDNYLGQKSFEVRGLESKDPILNFLAKNNGLRLYMSCVKEMDDRNIFNLELVALGQTFQDWGKETTPTENLYNWKFEMSDSELENFIKLLSG